MSDRNQLLDAILKDQPLVYVPVLWRKKEAVPK